MVKVFRLPLQAILYNSHYVFSMDEFCITDPNVTEGIWDQVLEDVLSFPCQLPSKFV